MAKVSKSKVVWAINETQSMRQASQLLGLAYNTFKKYANKIRATPIVPIQSVRFIWYWRNIAFKALFCWGLYDCPKKLVIL